METILRKVDDAKIEFRKRPDARMDVISQSLGTESDKRIVLAEDEVFEVRRQDGQLALVKKKLGSPAGGEEGQACLEILATCEELGGRAVGETLLDYLGRLIQFVTNITAYGGGSNFRAKLPDDYAPASAMPPGIVEGTGPNACEQEEGA